MSSDPIIGQQIKKSKIVLEIQLDSLIKGINMDNSNKDLLLDVLYNPGKVYNISPVYSMTKHVFNNIIVLPKSVYDIHTSEPISITEILLNNPMETSR